MSAVAQWGFNSRHCFRRETKRCSASCAVRLLPLCCLFSLDRFHVSLFICLKATSAVAPCLAGNKVCIKTTLSEEPYVCYPFCVVGLFVCFLPFVLSLCYSCVFAGGCAYVWASRFMSHSKTFNSRKTRHRYIHRAFNASTAESQQKHSQAAFILCQMQKHPSRCTSNYVFGNHVLPVSKYVFPFAQFFEPRIGHTQCPWGK